MNGVSLCPDLPYVLILLTNLSTIVVTASVAVLLSRFIYYTAPGCKCRPGASSILLPHVYVCVQRNNIGRKLKALPVTLHSINVMGAYASRSIGIAVTGDQGRALDSNDGAVTATSVSVGPLDFVISEGGAFAGYLVNRRRLTDLLAAADKHIEEQTRSRGATNSPDDGVFMLWCKLQDENPPSRELCIAAVRALLGASPPPPQAALLRDALPAGMVDANFLYDTGLPMSRLLDLAPHTSYTRSMYLEAIERDGMLLYHVPIERCDEDMCLSAVAQDGAALQFVPSALRTWRVCRRAVARCGAALAEVPPRLIPVQNYELVRIAAQTWPQAAAFVPLADRTLEMCADFLRFSVLCLPNIPEEYLTPEICEDLVRRDRTALALLPRDRITEELCLIAVVAQPSEDRRTAGVRAAAARGRASTIEASVHAAAARALGDVPLEMRTLRVCRAALRSQSRSSHTGMALAHVPEVLLDEVSSLALVRESWRCLEHLPPSCRTIQVCLAAVSQSAKALRHCPENLRTFEVCRAALSCPDATPECLDFVPECVLFPESDLDTTHRVSSRVFDGRQDSGTGAWEIALVALSVSPGMITSIIKRSQSSNIPLPGDMLFDALTRDESIATSPEFCRAIAGMVGLLDTGVDGG